MDADGYPNATDTSEYAGARVSGARTLQINDPEPQQVTHRGDDRVVALDVLPPTEPITGSLMTSKIDDVIHAILTDDASVTVGEAKLMGFGSDNRGDENQVIMLAYRQTVDTDPDSSNFGARRWEFRLFPKVYVIPRESGFMDQPEDKQYTIRPQYVKKYPWGVSFATGTEGFEQAQGFRGISQYKPRLVGFLGDDSETSFLFDTSLPAQSTDKIAVWVDGSLITSDITKATTGVEWTTAPTTDANIVIFYEHE
jgi:hypothetical protein